MSTDHEPALHASTCPEELGMGCGTVGAGHGLHAVQRAVAAATPSAWVDAVVAGQAAGGWTRLHAVEDGRELRVWHHVPLGVDAGEPVALHTTYHVLAAGARWSNVLVGDEPR